MFLASGGYKSWMLQNILQCTSKASSPNKELSDQLSNKSCLRLALISLLTKHVCVLIGLIHSADENLLSTRNCMKNYTRTCVCLFLHILSLFNNKLLCVRTQYFAESEDILDIGDSLV